MRRAMSPLMGVTVVSVTGQFPFVLATKLSVRSLTARGIVPA